MTAAGPERHRIDLAGTVQGVGFRPFVFRLATELGLGGWAANSPSGLTVEIEGPPAACAAFLERLRAEAPPHAVLRSLRRSPLPAQGERGFTVRASSIDTPSSADILPDLATCADCLRELFDPADRRYRYPFTNCTRCGPRYSILLSLPYDRDRTTMRRFPMCPACRAEYESPVNRRFHAEPIACPDCGPRLRFFADSGTGPKDPVEAAARAIESGQIVAVQGLGGFHLFADARDAEAIRRLRERKRRPAKPLAVMMPDLAETRRHVLVSPSEETLLTSDRAPIVLLRRRPDAPDPLPDALAPGNPRLGVLLPYTPPHHLLLRRLGFPVVATSGNLAEEPICTDPAEAVPRLGNLADAFLVHDRPIARAADDSVVREACGGVLVLRLGRGLAPLCIVPGTALPLPVVLAIGGDQKAALAVSGPDGVRCAPHLGDLESPLALDALEAQRQSFPRLWNLHPTAVACDLHPGYHGARAAETWDLPCRRVPHHHAHVVACLAEHGREDSEALGVAWDGTGFGPDGTIWGGEFLHVSAEGGHRIAWLRPFPLPGGELAVRQPRRAALGLLHELGIAPDDTPLADAFSASEHALLRTQLERRVHAPFASSAGRLFDAVAALLGLRRHNDFEGQAAADLESAADPADPEPVLAPLVLRGSTLDWEPLIRSLLEARHRGVPVPVLAASFHFALAEGIVAVARSRGIPRVALAGGCFQNVLLLELAVANLRAAGFDVLWPQRLPPNDGGLALGQAILASRLLPTP
jgi:hydrogenase maturation protein HypF